MMLWRLELACFKFDIIYRPENEREIARITDIIKLEHNLSLLHDQLCHPWIARMYNWIRFKNLPFSVEKVKRVVNLCSCCNEVKPRFCRNERESIKESSPFEWLNLDFKSPLPSVYRNRYLLTIIDEFYKIYLCNTMLRYLICYCHCSIFGIASYIRCDRGSSFMSRGSKEFLISLGVATSRTTAYNP